MDFVEWRINLWMKETLCPAMSLFKLPSIQTNTLTHTKTTNNYLNVCNTQDWIAIYERTVEKSVVIDDGAPCVFAFVHFTLCAMHFEIINHCAHAYDRWTASRHNIKRHTRTRTHKQTGLRMNDSMSAETQCLQDYKLARSHTQWNCTICLSEIHINLFAIAHFFYRYSFCV